MATLTALVEAGKALGYTGKELQGWVTDRENREVEREKERENEERQNRIANRERMKERENEERQNRIADRELRNSKENSLTGAIGTTYYVSPEVMSKSSRAYYDQKVDIYSLGIIFFEMCYRSFPTEHERGMILNNLRLATVSFPKDFDTKENAVQVKIICWLLSHNPKLRPTSKDLMNSSLVPFPTKNETELSQTIHSLLQNPNSPSHSQLMMTMFSLKKIGEQGINYDLANYENFITSDTALIYQTIKSVITNVFTNHGAIELPLPLLSKCSIYENDLHSVKLMNIKGRILMLPRDQRVSFAHFIGRKNIDFMKRFAIEKVFTENILQDAHPEQVTECAFDVIFSCDSLFHDSETLIIVQEIMNRCCNHQAKNLLVRINHMLLLKAVLLHCGISEDMHIKILTVLAETGVRAERAASLESNLRLSKAVMSRLISFLDIEGTLHKVKLNLKVLTSSTNKAGLLAKACLEDIETVVSFVRHMGFQSQIIVDLGFISKPFLYCGVFYQMFWDKLKNEKTDVIATGGRYDELIESYMLPGHKDFTSRQIHGVGISIVLESFVGALVQDKQFQRIATYDLLVCSQNKTNLTNEKIKIVGKLWSAGFKADVLLDNVEDVNDLIQECLSKGISHILEVIKIKPITIKVYSLGQESTVIRTMVIDELIEYIQNKQNETSPAQPESPWHDICSMDTSWTDI
ncbi:Eukaryotic translation initiation factor 2 alpha kinase 4 [Bulinus truncatus]|nr:Eukaryotic translation initiation factor 2 alpha kinase 4 [Bulinus truncatus]